jgi:DNA-binding transcriptional LysR family regulator
MTESSEPTWDLYRSFLEVLRTGSLSAASRALGLTQPTVGRQIAMLEKTLHGKPLFTRSRTGLQPTETARELRPHAELMASAAAALLRTASGAAEEMQGAVRVTASEVIGAEVLPPILTEFRARQPGVIVELSLSNQSADLLRRDADIAVRMVRPAQKALVARRVGKTALGLHASRQYIETRGMPRQLTDLLQHHALIGFDRTPHVTRGLKLPFPLTRDLFAYRCDSDLGQLAAIRAGFGVGVCQYGVAASSNPPLVAVLPQEVRFELDIWIVMHEALRKTARIRMMFDHLVASFAQYVARSGGPAR